MILFPNAKINLGLYVNRKRSDGYHDIQSIFYPIPFQDILEILPASKNHFSSSGIQVNATENLVLKAFRLMQERYHIGNVFIHLHKQIPLGAGLGGGSSDAAFCLKGLNKLFELELTHDTLETLALELGSDCPFFIRNKKALVTGRGEVLSKTSIDLKGQFLYLIYPDIHISTAEAFSWVTPRNKSFPKEISQYSNDFEKPAVHHHSELKKVREHLKNCGAYFVSLTGSGSAMYGLFNDKPETSGKFRLEKVMQLD